MALSASPPTHGATGGEKVDYVVVKRCYMVGNKDPDAVIPESGVLLSGHEPQYRTHGSYHEPAEDAVRKSTADQEDVEPEEESQNQEAEADRRVEQ